MKTIAFYISNHGFGHASRNIPLIKHLLKIDKNLNAIVKTHTKQLEFIKQSLGKYSSRIAYYNEYVDLGLILKENSHLVDKEKLCFELNKFISTWDEKIQNEKVFLVENKVALVVSDIVPWIFETSTQIGVKSLLISNFTWAEIYNELFANELGNIYEGFYKKANYVFEYPLSENMKIYSSNLYKMSLSCREFNNDNVKNIKARFKNDLIFVSLGRSVEINFEIDVEELPYHFIYTEGIKLRGSNTHKLPMDTINTHDYIKASVLIITKAGWSTVSEAICARIPMLVLNRIEIREDVNTINNLLSLGIAKTIEFYQLDKENLKVYIEETRKLQENYKFLSNRYLNKSKEIARKILEFLS